VIKIRTLLPVLAALCAAAPAFAQPGDAAGRYAQAMADADSLERYNSQLQEQLKSQQAEIASIERQLTEIETTNREVQPLMQQMVDTLAQIRSARRAVPARGTHGPRAGPEGHDGARRRHGLREVPAGFSMPTRSSSNTAGRCLPTRAGSVSGADARTVEFVQIGRVSLLYRTIDGSETGYYDSTKKAWVPDASYKEAVETAIRVARRDGALELLTVPVSAPQEVRS